MRRPKRARVSERVLGSGAWLELASVATSEVTFPQSLGTAGCATEARNDTRPSSSSGSTGGHLIQHLSHSTLDRWREVVIPAIYVEVCHEAAQDCFGRIHPFHV